MSHNFIKQFDSSKVCSSCGAEIGKDDYRDCPYPIVAQPAGNYVPVSISIA